MDAHGPYRPPRPFNAYFSQTSFPQLARLKQFFTLLFTKKRPEGWGRFMLSQYDGEIAYLDHQLGKLFSRLKSMGIYDSSLIIVTSDHGEFFGEHGEYGHIKPMYEEMLRVPLLIKFPFQQKTGLLKTKITSPDIFSTILTICDLPLPAGISGKAFGNPSVPVVSEVYKCWSDQMNGKTLGEHRVIYDGNYKYMKYEHIKEPELYDLKNDPQESHNLAQELPEITRALQDKINTWQKTHAPKYLLSKEQNIPYLEDSLEDLRALGYIE
jgi:arylsulfatase A-like enzyme